MKSRKQFEVLSWASLFLEEHNCEKPIAEILLQHHLNVTRSEFYMTMQEPISETIVNKFKADIEKHVQTGIPVQHLLGYEMFYGRKFTVNENTLIPRPETEELVQHVIELSKSRFTKQPLTILDIGTGSGVIAITLALEIPNAIVYATDISKKALQIAEENARQQQAKVTFLQGDFLQPIIDKDIKADMIVSNPPYIAKSDEACLSRTVKNFDPNLALFAEENGLAAYKQILELSTKVMEQDGIIAFEIGYEQGITVSSLIKECYPQSNVDLIQDINGMDRIVSTQL